MHAKTMSAKSKHLVLLFYKIFIPIYAFLPALQNLEDVSAVEVCSKLLAASFTRLPGPPRQSLSDDFSCDLSRARTSGSLRGPNPDCRVFGSTVPSRSFELSAWSDVKYEASRCHVEG
jgi:hypothetical protein